MLYGRRILGPGLGLLSMALMYDTAIGDDIVGRAGFGLVENALLWCKGIILKWSCKIF